VERAQLTACLRRAGVGGETDELIAIRAAGLGACSARVIAAIVPHSHCRSLFRVRLFVGDGKRPRL
jgi:hypothetical protein